MAAVYMSSKAHNKTKKMTKILEMKTNKKYSTFGRLKVGRITVVSSSATMVPFNWTLRTTRKKVCH